MRAALLALLGLLAVPAALAVPPEVPIDIFNFGFSPSDVTITTAEDARFQWVSGFHSVQNAVTFEEYCSARGAPAPDCVSDFPTIGDHALQCAIHPSMLMTLRVVEVSPPVPELGSFLLVAGGLVCVAAFVVARRR